MSVSNNLFIYYQDKNFYYFWKTANLSSSWWKSVSFLDLLCDEENNSEVLNIVKSQESFFGKEMELWLLNRLDKATTWLLYFAKNIRIYKKFRSLQKEWKVNKCYLAVVYGNIQNRVCKNWNVIKLPIMHHRFSDDRMIVVFDENDRNNWKWKIHEVETEIAEIEYNKVDNISIVVLKIHKWIRHQIRVHLSSIWYPICWDRLYCKSKKERFWKLQLFSIGMECLEI